MTIKCKDPSEANALIKLSQDLPKNKKFKIVLDGKYIDIFGPSERKSYIKNIKRDLKERRNKLILKEKIEIKSDKKLEDLGFDKSKFIIEVENKKP